MPDNTHPNSCMLPVVKSFLQARQLDILSMTIVRSSFWSGCLYFAKRLTIRRACSSCEQVIQKSSQFPLVSGLYKLLTVALTICRKEHYFEGIQVSADSSMKVRRYEDVFQYENNLNRMNQRFLTV